jgi:hypothetical protein
MTIKTVHIADIELCPPLEDGFDRLSLSGEGLEPILAVLMDLVNSGEIPRFVGNERVVERFDTYTKVTTTFATRDGAQKWVDCIREDNYGLTSIDVIED